MKTMKLGKTGIDIPRIGLGTWAIGGGPAFENKDNRQQSIDTIKYASKNRSKLYGYSSWI